MSTNIREYDVVKTFISQNGHCRIYAIKSKRAQTMGGMISHQPASILSIPQFDDDLGKVWLFPRMQTCHGAS